MADQVMSRLNGAAAQVRLSRTNPPRRLTMLGGGSTTYCYIITATGVRGTATSEAGLPVGADIERIVTS